MNRIDRLTTLVAGMNSNPECGDIDHENLVKLAAKQLAEIERVCPEATGCPQCVVSKQAVKDAIRQRDEVRDCGQEGVCAIAPGCQRHWAERNRELTALRPEATGCPQCVVSKQAVKDLQGKLAMADNVAEEIERLNDVTLRKAIAAERERCAKIAEESYAELQIEADNQSSDPKANGMLEGVGRIIAIAVAIREGKS